jgi:DNA-binding CsgD family transcriptional regulator
MEELSGTSARLACELSEVASSCRTLSAYRYEAMALLQRSFGGSVWSFDETTRGADSPVAALADWFNSASSEHLGRVCDGRVRAFDQLFAATWSAPVEACREQLAGRASALGFLLRGRVVTGIVLARDAAFELHELRALEAALPVHALAEALLWQQSERFASWADRNELTSRQREIAELAIRGLTNAEIGRVLCCSGLTVRNHLAVVFQKTSVSTRAELAFQAFSHPERTTPQASAPLRAG